jgi:16S rRNA (cytosine1402-N4)-methyltransferase
VGEKADSSAFHHLPVMVREVLEFLDCKPGQVILDCTVGPGGHARSILPKILPGGLLVGIDRDSEVLSLARHNLGQFKKNLVIRQWDFADLEGLAVKLSLGGLDGVLFDLGVSSWQLSDPARGFSFQHDGPLDMRMDRRQKTTVADLIKQLPEKELADIIYRYGGERRSRRISRFVVAARKRKPITTSFELARVITRARPGGGKIHPATRTFQALRIHLNRELEALRKALPAALDLLNPGGRICVLSFHSLEDRIVKQTFGWWGKEQGKIKVLTGKPLRPSGEEVRRNPRSRSARLRAAAKI